MKKPPDEYPSSRSQGSRQFPAAHFVRFTDAQNVLLHQVTGRLGRTIQSFLHDAAMQALGEVDGKLEAPTTTAITLPRGYGLRQRLHESALPSFTPPPSELEPPAPAPVPVPQIVINTGNNGTPDPEIDMLATFVAKGGSPTDRDKRLETAVQILGFTAKDEVERTRRAKTLDEKLATIEGQKKPSSTFDLLTDFFR